MTHPTPNDAMNDIERLIDNYRQDVLLGGHPLTGAGPRRAEQESLAALLAAIGKLVSSTQPAMSQDAQPVAQLTGCNCRWDGDRYVERCELHEAWHTALHEWADRARTAEASLAAHPPIPQEGKVMEALTVIAEWPCPQQDDMQAANMRAVAVAALGSLRSQVQGGLSTNNEEMK